MKPAVDIINGRIVGYDELTGEMTIKATYPDWVIAGKRKYSQCRIQLLDGRQISDKQRKTCYKLLREISDSTGNGLDTTKRALKQKFVEEVMHGSMDTDFSLSDAPMSLVCEFQRFLARFMLEFDIPSSFSLIEYVDDVADFLYACLTRRRCCICGNESDLHHRDHVGMGRDREEIVHEGMEVLPLCRVHHNEVHQIGEKSFSRKYHLGRGIHMDKYLCRLYGLKASRENKMDAINSCTGGSDDDQIPF